MNYGKKALEDLYNGIAGKPVQPRKHLSVLGEANVSIYAKEEGGNTNHIGDVSKEYYDEILKNRVELGSQANVSLRGVVEQRLDNCNGNIDNNADIWQNYMLEGAFDMSDANFKSSEEYLLSLMEQSTPFYLTDFIKANWPDADVTNKYYKPAFLSIPKAPVFGSPGAGELYLAYFVNGNKPKKGDLSVGGVEVELKGPGGRIFKSPKIINDFSDLQKDPANEDELLENITEFIAKLSQTVQHKSLILSIVKLFKDSMIKEYNYFKERGKLRPGNELTYIGGLAQLYAYKQVQGFDIFMSFFIQEDGRVLLKPVNMRKTSNLIELHNLISKDTFFKFGVNRDGGGWSLDRTQAKN
tara:strand:- start:1400 stop:2464 length:1065 start_codon:yes stop_codon:yes gene_type:complete